MSIVLARRLQGYHFLLEMALADQQARLRPDDRTVAGIKKKKLVIKDRLAAIECRQTPSQSRWTAAEVGGPPGRQPLSAL